MKRGDEGRLIKIPDPSAVAAVVGQMNARASPMGQSNLASITPIFPNRSSHLAPQHIGAAIPVTAHDSSNAAQRPGVAIFRGDQSSVATPGVPITVHSSGVVVTPSTGTTPQTPTVIHGLSSAMMHHNTTTLKTETISLPTAPINVQYVGAFNPANSVNGPSVVIKTGGNMTGPSGTNIQLQTPNVQGRVHSGSPLHQNVTFSSPTVMRAQVSTSTPQPPSSLPQTTSGVTVTGIVNPTRDTSTPSNTSSSFQRLKVEDALSYLDQVKFKFGNQPQVYNDFLDIMKEFKSQSIDTPGVIARVSSLFRGHPELIVGFNTFLPPGYKIEIHSSDSIAISIPGSLQPTLQTIVHTPHGIQKMNNQPASTLVQAVPKPAVARPPQIQTPPGIGASQIGNTKFHLQQQGTTISPYQPATGQALINPGPTIPKGSFHQHIPLPSPSQNLHPVGQDLSSQRQGSSENTPPRSGTQPVEFNHAINYVNKIKTRFANQPDVYKQFLEILHTYQRDQKIGRESQRLSNNSLTEAEVYSQVAKLFQNQEDLLTEFSQFLPEATGEGLGGDYSSPSKRLGSNPGELISKFDSAMSQVLLHSAGSKRLGASLGGHGPPSKKVKIGFLHDVSLAEASKFGSLNDFAFFDRVRKAIRNPDAYDNFIRCIILYNQEIVSRVELVQLCSPILMKHPDLLKVFKDFVGHRSGEGNHGFLRSSHADLSCEGRHREGFDEVKRRRNDGDRGKERIPSESLHEIDFSNSKRLGASYCAFPRNTSQPSCSGRTALCKEVLNDTWVSFPTWSEDSQFVSSRKTQFEEAIYRTEDERFEFDMVLETNKDTIKVLECVLRKMNRMPPEEAARYHLDDCLGGSSPTIHQRAVRRIYGEKAIDIIEGLKRNPVVAVPLVLKRLRDKDQEWRDAFKSFNKVWRDQNEKYYLKSLDHKCLIFKQTDIRQLRSKTLLNEIENLFDERHEQSETNQTAISTDGPHLTFNFPDFKVLEDVNNLLIHHVKRQTSIHKEEKQKIKTLLKHFLMDCYKHCRQDLSDDEREEDDNSSKEDELDAESSSSKNGKTERSKRKGKDDDSKSSNTDGDGEGEPEGDRAGEEKEEKQNTEEKPITEADIKVEIKDGRRTPFHARDMPPCESYTLFMANNYWYMFFRLHQILCERLSKMHSRSQIIADQEAKDKKDSKPSAAEALKMKPKIVGFTVDLRPEEYYATFLDMVKNLLDGNMEALVYEDTLREMFGIHAYVAFTLDKVVSNTVRQLQNLVSDETCIDCFNLHNTESKSGGTGGDCCTAFERYPSELVYQKKAEKLLSDENCMKIYIYHETGLMTIELLDAETPEDRESEKEEDLPPRKTYNSTFISRFVDSEFEVSTCCQDRLRDRPIFLPRCRRYLYKKMRSQMSPQIVEDLLPDVEHPKPIRPIESAASESSDSKNEEKEVETVPDSTSEVKEEVEEKEIDKDVENVTDQSVDKPNEDTAVKKPVTGSFFADLKMMGDTEALQNYSIVIVGRGNCFMRKYALKRGRTLHRRVTVRKLNAYIRWHAAWVRQNVTDSQILATEKWFNGSGEDFKPNRTIKITSNTTNNVPYRNSHKWRVDEVK